MKFLALLATALVAVSTSSTVNAESLNGIDLPAESRHPLSLERRNALMDQYYRDHPLEKHHNGGSKKKCKAKTHKAAGAKTHATTYKSHKAHKQSKSSHDESHSDSHKHDSHKQHKSSSSSSSSSAGSGKKAANDAKSNWSEESQSSSNESHEFKESKESKSSSSSSSSSESHSSSSSSSGSGLFGISIGSCGSSGANNEQPNGSQSFLNCGIDKGGWNPPHVKLDELRVVDADTAVKGVFAPCKPHVWAFKQAAKAHNLPATLLMSFAMQESTCNPQVTGGNGEQGLMQITNDKCGGAPNGNCKDVYFNVNAGAKYFKSQLDECNGSVLEAMGRYNGWYKGLTVNKATAARWQGNCHAQNNLDYLFQMLNGWLLGKSNSYDMGKYQNLKACK